MANICDGTSYLLSLFCCWAVRQQCVQQCVRQSLNAFCYLLTLDLKLSSCFFSPLSDAVKCCGSTHDSTHNSVLSKSMP